MPFEKPNMRHALKLAAIAAPLLASSGCASNPAGGATSLINPNPAVVKTLEMNHAKIEKSFPVGESVIGFAVSTERGKGVIYQVGEDYALIGTLFGAEGQNLTTAHNSEHVFDLAGAFEQMKHSARTIVDKDGEPLNVWGMYEPNCPYCAMAIVEFHNRGINVQWVPVMFLNDNSASVMAAVWAADDPAVMLREAAHAKSANTLDQFIAAHPVTDTDRAATAQILRTQFSWMMTAGLNGTPSFVMEVEGKPVVSTIEDILAKYAPPAVSADALPGAVDGPGVTQVAPH